MSGGFSDATIWVHPFSAMTGLPDSHPPIDHYEAALEASCDTLIALQLLSAAAGSRDETGDVQARINGAISSLWSAIAELRLAHAKERNARVVGFVLATAEDGGGEPS